MDGKEEREEKKTEGDRKVEGNGEKTIREKTREEQREERETGSNRIVSLRTEG